MSKNVVLTGVGRDRVGIVAELAEVLFDLGCNLLDSSMTLLRGEFAVILMAQLSEGGSIEELRLKLDEAEEKLGMKVFVRELPEEAMTEGVEEQLYIVSVYGADRPGIVAGVTRELADLGANLTDVETKKTSAEKPLFLMVLEVTRPESLAEEEMESRLKVVAEKLEVDLSIQQVEVVDL